VRRDVGVGTAEQFGLQLPREEPDGCDRQCDETGLRATRARSLAGKSARYQQGRDRDQTGNGQPAKGAELTVLRSEEGAEAGKRDERAGVGNDFGRGDRGVDAPTLPSP
jgi:hypothetical protein